MTKSALSATAPHGDRVHDGYLRVTGNALRGMKLEHLLSGLDDDGPGYAPGGAGATTATFAGFTEWVGHCRPAVSIGWDWQAGLVPGAARYLRVGPPRSNLMLVDARGRDLGFEFTAAHVGSWVDQQAWQQPVAAFLSKMYA